MINWAFIFEATETDPVNDRTVIEGHGVRLTIVAIPYPDTVTQVAVELVAEGAQFIELCGGFEPNWTAKVIEATGGRVPVGSVG